MSAGQTSRAAQAAATRSALLEAAKRVFATHGYLNTKITDVTAAAGRSAGSFYSHFASKEELLAALLEEVGAAGDSFALSPDHKADFRDPEAIRFHVEVFWRVYQEHRATMRALYEASLVNREFAERLAGFRRAQLAELAGHLSSVAALPASVEASLALASGAMEQATQLDLPADQAIEAATRFIYRALNAKDY